MKTHQLAEPLLEDAAEQLFDWPDEGSLSIFCMHISVQTQELAHDAAQTWPFEADADAEPKMLAKILEKQDLCCMYLAHHELESLNLLAWHANQSAAHCTGAAHQSSHHNRYIQAISCCP